MTMTETHNSGTLPVLIAGAGLSGLSLAAILTHKSVPFILFEAGPRRDKCQGYGITLRSWAYEPLLRSLREADTEEAIAAFRRSVAVDAAIGGVGRIEAAVTDANTGELLVPNTSTEHDIRANWAKAREWLVEKIGAENVQWQAKVAEVRTNCQGVMVQLDGGQQVRGRCLVAADGVHSSVRSILLPSTIPKPLPVVAYAWQRTIPRTAYNDFLAQYFHSTSVLLGIAQGVSVEISMIDIDDATVQMGLTRSRRYDPTEPQSHQETTTIHADIQREVQCCGELVSPYSDLLNRPLSEGDELYRLPARSLRISKWDLDRTCEQSVFLIGDAAHAMPNFAGQSASQCLLDGVELAALLANAGDDVSRTGRKFYDGAAERWYQGIEESENMIENLHRTGQECRDVVQRS